MKEKRKSKVKTPDAGDEKREFEKTRKQNVRDEERAFDQTTAFGSRRPGDKRQRDGSSFLGP